MLEKSSKSSSDLRVLVLSDSFLPHAGGSREYYYNIYSSLTKVSRTKVTVATTKVAGWREFDAKASSPQFCIKRCGKPLRSWKYSELPKGVVAFVHAIWRTVVDRPHFIHAGDLYPQGLTALVLKRLFRIPFLIYCHGEEITQTDKFRHQPKVRNQIYRSADAVVANSEFTCENLIRIGVLPERIHKITPGVDAKRFRHAPPRSDLQQKYGLNGKTVVLTVARLVPRKGHRVSLQAFAKIAAEFPQAHYLIVGTGPEERPLREMVGDLGLNERVTFAGFVAGEQLPDIYNLADVMVMANRQEENGDVEGFGIVFLEANAAGKPVVGGRSGGAIEAVVDSVTGFLVDPNDPSELADKLRMLLGNDGLRTRMGTEGIRRTEEDFDWLSRARKLNEISSAIPGRAHLPGNHVPSVLDGEQPGSEQTLSKADENTGLRI